MLTSAPKVIGGKYSEQLVLNLQTAEGKDISFTFTVEETNELRAILREDLAEQYGDAWD